MDSNRFMSTGTVNMLCENSRIVSSEDTSIKKTYTRTLLTITPEELHQLFYDRIV